VLEFGIRLLDRFNGPVFMIPFCGPTMCWEKAVAAERSKELLLQELNHRVRNNLFMLACRLQMRLQSEQAAKDAFSAAIGRVLIIPTTTCCRNAENPPSTWTEAQRSRLPDLRTRSNRFRRQMKG
jgi:histidine kinase